MTEDDLKEFLDANRDDIARHVKTTIIDGLVARHKWEMSDAIAKVVNDFISAEIVPEVRKYLEGEKGAILAASLEAARQIGEVVTQKMVETAAKNVAGYQFRKIMEGLFQ